MKRRGGSVLRRTSWKVGELARETGLSVRALHYYDEIGLLSPLRRTEAGHRLYDVGDVARLQQIKSLRALGFGLAEVRDCLDRPGFSLRRVIDLHLARLREQIKLQQKLCNSLEAVAARLGPAGEVSVEECVETIMEVISMSERLEKYYAPEQLEELDQRRRNLGEERIQRAEAEWTELMEQVRVEMEKGTDPSDDRVQLLAGRWMELVQEFTDGNPGIERSVGNMWQQEGTIYGIDTRRMREMMEYVSKATAAASKPQ